MHPDHHHALRYFPLIGWARPPGLPLPELVDEVADAVRAANQPDTDQLRTAAQALNHAALIASDHGLPDLAADLCWHHINAYRQPCRPLSYSEALLQIEPVINLARLKLRASDGQGGHAILNDLYQAVATGTNLTLDGTTINLTGLTGTSDEHRHLVETAWKQLVGDGVRALALDGRWAEAAAHADQHAGIGQRPRAGRQAMIISRIVGGEIDHARALIEATTVNRPWEHVVRASLAAMLDSRPAPSTEAVVEQAATELHAYPITATHIVFRTRAGLAISALATPISRPAGSAVRRAVVDAVVQIRDGCAAREILRDRLTSAYLTKDQAIVLSKIVNTAGLGKAPPPSLRTRLLELAESAQLVITKIIHGSPIPLPASP